MIHKLSPEVRAHGGDGPALDLGAPPADGRATALAPVTPRRPR